MNFEIKGRGSIVLAAIAMILGLSIGVFLFRSSSSSRAAAEYPLINKTITANIGKHFIINFKPLKSELIKIQNQYPNKTFIYFSYLNSGAWVGLNERDDFVAASTIKVPLAMAVLKAVEEQKLKLSDSYALSDFDLDVGFGDLYKAGAGEQMTIAQLLEIMLEHSDNTAQNALLEVLNRIGITNPLQEVYAFLGWEFKQEIPSMGQPVRYAMINLKTLANLFLALYDARYLTLDHSNQILAYLAQTPFSDRIAAGVPSAVTVSHKIGTAGVDNTYSDCGIIYAPNRNYILCVGSAGANEKTADTFMAQVSKATYDFVINH